MCILARCKHTLRGSVWNLLWRLNLVPRACDSREGTRGSGIIRFREESDCPFIWNAQFNLSQDSWLPATDYPRASCSFPRIAGSGNSAFFNYISGGGNCPPRERICPPPVKPFLPPKCEAELLMIAVRIAVDLLDEIMPSFHSLLHSHLVCNSYCSSLSIS